MNAIEKAHVRTATLIGAALAGLCAAMPALAATLDFPMPLSTRDILLVGALVLLLVALGVRLTRRVDSRDSLPDAPDMRWWRNPQT